MEHEHFVLLCCIIFLNLSTLKYILAYVEKKNM